MSNDRRWMYERKIGHRVSPYFISKVDEFMEYAIAHNPFNTPGSLKCPCKRCQCVTFRTIDVVKLHLRKWGFKPYYERWVCHGEDPEPSRYTNRNSCRRLVSSTLNRNTVPPNFESIPKDRQWMYERKIGHRVSLYFISKVDEFIEYATAHDPFNAPGSLKCPCKRCKFDPLRTVDVVKQRLRKWGFQPYYERRLCHGEDPEPTGFTHRNRNRRASLESHGSVSTAELKINTTKEFKRDHISPEVFTRSPLRKKTCGEDDRCSFMGDRAMVLPVKYNVRIQKYMEENAISDCKDVKHQVHKDAYLDIFPQRKRTVRGLGSKVGETQESDDSMSSETRAAMMAQLEDAKQQLAKIDAMIKEQRSRMALMSEFMRQLSQDQKWIDLFSRMGFPLPPLAPPPSNDPLS